VLIKGLSVVGRLFGLELALPALGKFWTHSALRNDGVILEAYLSQKSPQRPVGIALLTLKEGLFNGFLLPLPVHVSTQCLYVLPLQEGAACSVCGHSEGNI